MFWTGLCSLYNGQSDDAENSFLKPRACLVDTSPQYQKQVSGIFF